MKRLSALLVAEVLTWLQEVLDLLLDGLSEDLPDATFEDLREQALRRGRGSIPLALASRDRQGAVNSRTRKTAP